MGKNKKSNSSSNQTESYNEPNRLPKYRGDSRWWFLRMIQIGLWFDVDKDPESARHPYEKHKLFTDEECSYIRGVLFLMRARGQDVGGLSTLVRREYYGY